MSDGSNELRRGGAPHPARTRLATGAFCAASAHFALLAASGHLRWEHYVLDGVLAAFALGGRRTAALLRAGLPLWLALFLYLDLQQLAFASLRGEIHTGDLFLLDAALFPAPGEEPMPWAAWFATRANPIADLFAGIAYMGFVAPFFGTLLVYLFVEPDRAEAMGWCFFAANVIAVSAYTLYPAAPPWYVLAHGLGPADPAALPHSAGAGRFDEMFGVGVFAGIYSMNPNVFGAMPSLHAAYPLIAVWHLWHRGIFLRVFSIGFAALVAFSAVYLSHHYVLDVIAGMATAPAACAAGGAIAARLTRARRKQTPGRRTSPAV